MAKLIISPQTKVGELLNVYPELEALLITLAPAFSALKNPILRRTAGRVATLSQAAVMGGIRVDELVNRLRAEVGQETAGETPEESSYLTDTPPSWFDRGLIADTYDATPVINSGGSPMVEILHRAGKLEAGRILAVNSPFVPAPILDLLIKKDYKVFSEEKNGLFVSYITMSQT